ncbi:hypothetical protein WB334_25130, partial [Escherichia coli]|uniref:hypothetical protein n=1 Tax=Escherichia coli TaxID=562 RepID=UPI002157ECD7
LASTGTARPNSNSEQDTKDFIVRYRYTGSQSPDRPFCQKMMASGKLYRKEDIIRMGDFAVNPGWGPNGRNTYNIWFYKGGGNCHHAWNRVIFLKNGLKVDVNSPLADIISVSEARRKGLKIESNDEKVGMKPKDMPFEGFLPTKR